MIRKYMMMDITYGVSCKRWRRKGACVLKALVDMLWEKTFGHISGLEKCYISFNFLVPMPSASPVLPEAQLLNYSTGHPPA